MKKNIYFEFINDKEDNIDIHNRTVNTGNCTGTCRCDEYIEHVQGINMY